MSDLPSLPAEVLSRILTDLPIHTIMKVVMGNHFFTNEVLRKIPRLCITRTKDLDIPTARRLLDGDNVEQVYINSLVSYENRELRFCSDTANRD
jgi:hypothetical protein